MIDPGLVSAVLVTRGDQDLTPIYDTIAAAGIRDVVTWDNSLRPDKVCYGRYLGIQEARNPMIYFQDDDLTLDVGLLLDSWRFGLDTGILANNRIDEEWPLIGIGSLFHRDAADCFTEYLSVYPEDREFYRTCDVVFGYLNAYRRICIGYQDLPWGTSPTASMYLEPDHMDVRLRTRQRTLMLSQVPA